MSALIRVLCNCERDLVPNASKNIVLDAIQNHLAVQFSYSTVLPSECENIVCLLIDICDNFASDSCEVLMLEENCIYQDLQYKELTNDTSLQERALCIMNIFESILKNLAINKIIVMFSSDYNGQNIKLNTKNLIQKNDLSDILKEIIYNDSDDIVVEYRK